MIRVWGLVLAAVIVSTATAQQTRETFGKNRIQYKQFEWKYLTSENFDVFYYDTRRTVASEVTEFLESEFDRVTDLIGWPPYLKTKVFLYNSVAELQQSNIGLNDNPYTIGGETQFIKPYVEIAHPGTLAEFKEELLYKVSDLMVNQMMFGGSLKDMFQNSVLLNLPDWFIKGASMYVARGWNEEMDDFSRQLVRSRKVNRALNFTGHDAALVGQSIWNYIVEKYGKSSVSNILNYTRVIRNEQKSIYITLGISFRQLILDWKSFYLANDQRVSESYYYPADSNRFTPPHRKTTVYPTMKVSPDGKKIAYAENDRGKFTVKVKSLVSGKESTILGGGQKVIKQAVDYRVPLVTWADDHTLGVIGIHKGEFIFWLYDLSTKSKLPRRLEKFNNIRSFDFSSNGRLAVLSADIDGQNDLFLISSRRDRVRRLTNDIFDDLDPSFVPNTNSVVFSSNRVNDTINTRVRGLDKISSENYNLFVFDLDTTEQLVARITNTLGRDYYPFASDQNTFYYLSDQRGITNLFKYDRISGIYSQVTNFASSIKEYDVEFGSRTVAMVATRKLSEDIFVLQNFNIGRQVFTPPTRRKEIMQAKVISERRKQTVEKGMSLKDLINQRLNETKPEIKNIDPIPADSLQTRNDSLRVKPKNGEVDTDNYEFEEEQVFSDTASVKIDVSKPLNTEDYVFEDEEVKAKEPAESFLSRYLKASSTSKILGPFTYSPRFTYENFITNFVIDPIRGFSMRMEAQMNDMLENYRLYGGVQTAFDWKSGDVFAEFQYLPHYFDYSARFERKAIFWSQPETNNQEKYTFQKIELGVSFPLSVRTRVSLKPFVGFARYVDRGPEFPSGSAGPTFMPSRQEFYGGTKAEVVFDNSVTTGLNLIEGTRAKIGYLNSAGLTNSKSGFSQIYVDFRHYQKIYKEIVLAVRGYAGTFFGQAPKKYALGGMDNWFINQTNRQGQGNPLANTSAFNPDLLFLEFATNLRGFDYATLYGSSVALANVEFRLPLIRALSGGPIASNFFRNMQFTAFYDIGSSWTGPPPFSAENSVRKRIVPDPSASSINSPFEIELNEYLNPWIYSYGFGFRSMMLGYYMKFDLAWPVENYKVKDPRISVTLGFDF